MCNISADFAPQRNGLRIPQGKDYTDYAGSSEKLRRLEVEKDKEQDDWPGETKENTWFHWLKMNRMSG
jgi:hypothetical protein